MTIAAPWTYPLSQGEYLTVSYVLSVAALAFLAAFIRSCVTQHEVGSRYRTVVVARLAITAVSFLSYVGLLVAFTLGYHRRGTAYLPGPDAVITLALRYSEWSLAVPLLTVEILAVCALSGLAARRTIVLTMASAFGMIFTGFLGGIVGLDAGSLAAVIGWGLVSCVLWAATTLLLVRAVATSRELLTAEAHRLLRRANIILLSGFVIYPLVYLIPLLFTGGRAATAIQVTLTAADVVVKVLCGDLLLRVAKLRTAEDVRAGDDVHPESIWISSVKQSDAGRPREVYLAAGSAAHDRRSPEAQSAAIPTTSARPWSDDGVDPDDRDDGDDRDPEPVNGLS